MVAIVRSLYLEEGCRGWFKGTAADFPRCDDFGYLLTTARMLLAITQDPARGYNGHPVQSPLHPANVVH